jgi:superfamily II DNA helicase RecQ
MIQKGITREMFYKFITEDEVFKELKKIQNFSFDYLIQKLHDQMGRVDKLLQHIGENTETLPEDEKIRMVLELVCINLTNLKMEFFEKFILTRQEQMFSQLGPFAQLMGAKPPSENKTKLLKKFQNHVSKYENRETDFFKDECERFNYVATKLMKRISKVYSLIPDEKEQTNESILDWELHQKLMEKRYGKRPIDTSYKYKK